MTLELTRLKDSDNDMTPLDLKKDAKSFIKSKFEITYQMTGHNNVYKILPALHLRRDIRWLYQLDMAVQNKTHLSNSIKVIEFETYCTTPERVLMDMLRDHAAILIINEPVADLGFSEKALSKVCNPHRQTTLQSLWPFTLVLHVTNAPESGFVYHGKTRTQRGRPIDLLHSLSERQPTALSALDLPASQDSFVGLPFASDVKAWRRAQGHAFCKSDAHYPVSHMRWGLAATYASHHYWHMDSDGLGTFVKVETGIKIWYIATPKSGNF
ncbi:hypothetical protein C0995_012819 [Termitomyces sp. Mi166|nr:hypothetical protein C0995_012819 [Termitomyces sp. Mi166\